jgi:hypothetical protein
MTDERIREWAADTLNNICTYDDSEAEKLLESAARSLISEVRREVKLQTLEEAAKVCETRIDYGMQIPCPDGIPGCCVLHTIPAKRAKNALECASAIRKLAEREGER